MADGFSNVSKSVVSVPVEMVSSVQNMVSTAMGTTAEVVNSGVEAGVCMLSVPTSMLNDIADAVEGNKNGSSFSASC